MSERRPFVGGNWKMNTTLSSALRLAREVVGGLAGLTGADVAIFPPFPYLSAVGGVLRDRASSIKLGAQGVCHHPDGAFTGEVSIAMLQDCGVGLVLTGHSERRHALGEADELVNAKTSGVLNAGLGCVLCIGETLDQRQAGQTDEVNERQLRAGLAGVPHELIDERLTIAYEPVWAIGTGRTATAADAQDAHAKIRATLAGLYSRDRAGRVRIQYGGSVKPANAGELFAQPDIDGGLVGGASLNAGDFIAIVQAAARMA